MVNGFEWAVIGLILFGMVIPFWVMVVLTVIVVEQGRRKEKANRATYSLEYAKLMRELSQILSDDSHKFNGPSLIACIRDLKKFPEFRDASILFLDGLDATGKNKFDDMARTEIKNVDAYLLDLEDD